MERTDYTEKWKKVKQMCQQDENFLEDIKAQLAFVRDETRRDDLTGKILQMFEQEEGLTYTEALSALCIVKQILEMRMYFIQLPLSGKQPHIPD